MAFLAAGFLGRAFSDPDTAQLLTDRAYCSTLLEVEAALARAHAAVGVIPPAAASEIEEATRRLSFDGDALCRGVERDGTPVVALVAMLRERAGDSGQYVHWGATSQDILDTATVLQVRQVLARFESMLLELMAQWARLSHQHRGSVMAARTHGQQTLPTCFGLKVALWLSPLIRHFGRLDGLRSRVLRTQFGGSAGTLASLGPAALAVSQAFARELGLKAPDVPWHTQRDGFAELGGWVSSLSGSLGKMAQDVILLSQSELGELAEQGSELAGDRVRSPPHAANNPLLSEQILAAARHNASLLSSLHHAMVQEQERATHGWQLEWLALAPMLNLTGGALNNALQLTERLQIFPEKMIENLDRNHGLVLAEAALGELAKRWTRPEAQERVREAAERASSERRSFVEILEEGLAAEARARAAASSAGLPEDEASSPSEVPLANPNLSDSLRPEAYLGQAGVFIDRVLADAGQFIVSAPVD